MTVLDAIARHRIVVVVGTGGVGKTTVSAALALAAAQQGRRAIVLTIDPARALARALGIADLASEPQAVPVDVPGRMLAAMLDQKHAWDAFVARHAPSPSVVRALLDNPFYQRLSTSFAGSTEYMAVEEMCRLVESGDHDLIVLDTPPAAHALDFLRAPAKIDRLLDRELTSWLVLGRGAWRSAGATARFVLRRLERATGKSTLRDITAFFVALDALVGAVLDRTRRARALLRGGDAAYVLVAGPRQLVLDETRALAGQLRQQAAPLAAVVLNRVHAVPELPLDTVEQDLAALGDTPAARWLRRSWGDAVAEAADARATIARFTATLPSGLAVARVAEAGHDLHSLADVALVASALAHQPSTATAMPVTAISPPAALSP